jgi:XTP/dITP diphosphohydrolase
VDLLIATRNPGKMKEMRALLNLPGLKLIMPSEIGLNLEIRENGVTYAENAILKARAFTRESGLLSLADDSGLEVDALGGLPGLHSARFVEKPFATDADRRLALLERLAAHPRPWIARFRCLVALANPTGEIELREGVCEGEIIPEERGQKGFGYDPIFFVHEKQKTMAELSMAEKNLISHRARAIQQIRSFLLYLLANS